MKWLWRRPGGVWGRTYAALAFPLLLLASLSTPATAAEPGLDAQSMRLAAFCGGVASRLEAILRTYPSKSDPDASMKMAALAKIATGNLIQHLAAHQSAAAVDEAEATGYLDRGLDSTGTLYMANTQEATAEMWARGKLCLSLGLSLTHGTPEQQAAAWDDALKVLSPLLAE